MLVFFFFSLRGSTSALANGDPRQGGDALGPLARRPARTARPRSTAILGESGTSCRHRGSLQPPARRPSPGTLLSNRGPLGLCWRQAARKCNRGNCAHPKNESRASPEAAGGSARPQSAPGVGKGGRGLKPTMLQNA